MGATTFAVSELFLGDTDPCTPAAGMATCTGTPDTSGGWKNLGYDLDGQNDTATTVHHCKPACGAQRTTFQNGNNGIDNSFGKTILPIILGLSSSASTTINNDIKAGKFTIMFSIASLGTGSEYNPLTTTLYAGAALTAAPAFDGTDTWPYISGVMVPFASSYLVPNPTTGAGQLPQEWVSGSKGNITLSLSISGFSLSLPISAAQMSFQLDAGHKQVANGIIAGVLATGALTSQLQEVAGSFDPSLCMGQTIDSILTEIAGASDIYLDPNTGAVSQDPTQTCNGISIGLGFNGYLVTLGASTPPPMPKPNPCNPDGGSGSSSSGFMCP